MRLFGWFRKPEIVITYAKSDTEPHITSKDIKMMLAACRQERNRIVSKHVMAKIFKYNINDGDYDWLKWWTDFQKRLDMGSK